MPKPGEISSDRSGGLAPDLSHHESLAGKKEEPATAIAMGGKVIHEAAHDKSAATLKEKVITKAEFGELVERSKKTRSRLEIAMASAQEFLASSGITTPASIASRISEKASLIFGNADLFREPCKPTSLKEEILKLHYAGKVPLRQLEAILDDLHAKETEENGVLDASETLNILEKLSPIIQKTRVGKGSELAGSSLDTQDLANSERTELAGRLEDLAKYVLASPKINEFSSKDTLLTEIADYLRKNNAIQAQIDSVQSMLAAFNETDAPIDRIKILLSAAREAVKLVDDQPYDAIARSQFSITKGSEKGKGGIGVVYEVDLDGQTKLLKEFNGLAFPIRLDQMSDPSNPSLVRSLELTATYLHADELDTIVAPTHYLVAERRPGEPDTNYLVEVSDKEFRGWAKHKLISNSETPGYSLEITGSLQNYAKGIELFSYLKNTPAIELRANAKAICTSYLDALEVLCKRGFVHGDLKAANAFYEPTTQKISLIDTGGLTKVSKLKERQESTKFNFIRAFTPHYTVPDIFRKKSVGFDQDLFSVGLQMLEVVGRAKFPNSAKCAKMRNEIRATYDQALNKTKSLSRAQNEMLKIAFDGLSSIAIDPISTEHEELEAIALISVFLPLNIKGSLVNRDSQLKLIELLKTNPSLAAKRILAK
jgi:serine/threonine protein kinase